MGRPAAGRSRSSRSASTTTDVSVAVVPRIVVGRVDGDSFRHHRRRPTADADPRAARRSARRTPARRAGSATRTPTCRSPGSPRPSAPPPRGSAPASSTRSCWRTISRRARCCPVDERFLLRHLAAGYPDCWTFAVEGLVGASPELLIRRRGRAIASRVLAGTAWPERPTDAAAAELLGSAQGHRRARVRGPVGGRGAARRRRSTSTVPDAPRPAGAGEPRPPVHRHHRPCSDDTAGMPTALDLAARLHPTAAVGGSPAPVARQVIRELEPIPARPLRGARRLDGRVAATASSRSRCAAPRSTGSGCG